jgi:hypothetical protein
MLVSNTNCHLKAIIYLFTSVGDTVRSSTQALVTHSTQTHHKNLVCSFFYFLLHVNMHTYPPSSGSDSTHNIHSGIVAQLILYMLHVVESNSNVTTLVDIQYCKTANICHFYQQHRMLSKSEYSCA